MGALLNLDNFLLISLIGLILFILIVLNSKSNRLRFRMKPLLTENEIEFYGRLLTALPNYHIFPQVALRAFIAPYSRSQSKTYLKEFNSIGSKHCDFLICDKETLRVITIIELDDKTHNVTKDKIRDSMTASAGFKTIRFQSREKPSIQEIKLAIKGVNNE